LQQKLKQVSSEVTNATSPMTKAYHQQTPKALYEKQLASTSRAESRSSVLSGACSRRWSDAVSDRQLHQSRPTARTDQTDRSYNDLCDLRLDRLSGLSLARLTCFRSSISHRGLSGWRQRQQTGRHQTAGQLTYCHLSLPVTAGSSDASTSTIGVAHDLAFRALKLWLSHNEALFYTRSSARSARGVSCELANVILGLITACKWCRYRSRDYTRQLGRLHITTPIHRACSAWRFHRWQILTFTVDDIDYSLSQNDLYGRVQAQLPLLSV